MILAFRLRRVARGRQRNVLKSFVLPGPGRRRRLASIMTDRTLDRAPYPKCRMERLPSWVLCFELRSHDRFNYKTYFYLFFGRRRTLVEGGGGRAGSVLVANSVPGPPPRPGVSGTAEHEVKYRCQPMPPRKKSSGVGGPD
jgi:hypothetical protein